MTLAGRVRGQGPNLVRLHGWGLSSRVWAPLVARLAPHVRCHALDLPGHGRSRAVRGLEYWVDAVAASAPASAIYLGWSLGGLVATALAQRYPERVAALAVTASAPRLTRADDWPWGLTDTTLGAIRHGLSTDFAVTLSQFIDQQVRGTPDAQAAAARLKADLKARPPDPAGLDAGLEIIAGTDLRAGLETMAMPALLVSGERDRLAHPRAMQAMADAMPDARHEQLRHAAHAPFVSHEAWFADALKVLIEDTT